MRNAPAPRQPFRLDYFQSRWYYCHNSTGSNAMMIQIISQFVTPDAVSYREIGFGEKPTGIPLSDYRLDYPITEMLVLLRPAYDAWIRDQRADDEATGDPYPGYFHDLGYPQLDDFAKHPV